MDKEQTVAPNGPKSYKQKWLDKLRSGGYKQTYGKYYDFENNSYCAVGLLRFVASEGEYHRVQQKLEGLEGIVMVMNDKYHKTFAEIADWIEANIPEF